MLSIGAPEQALCADAIEAPGGFAWWYADLVDGAGNGLVLIWAFGLPFLPGRESRARRGEGRPGRSRPSLAISVYEAGRPSFYLLQEYDEDDADVDFDTGRCRLGNSRFWSREEGGRRRVDVSLDLPVPASARLTGSLSIEGAPLQVPRAEVGAGWHVWAPLTTATDGRARFLLGDDVLVDLQGRAYHDANGSVRPLSGLGIHEWAWGREAADGHEEVHYVLWPEGGGAPEAHLMRMHGDGRVEIEPAVVLSAPRRYGWWGLPWHRSLHLRGLHTGRERVVRPGAVVDDGPFYLRSLLGTGTGEWVRPARVDLWWMRPFVAMCVHRPSGPNPWLLPFFTGRLRDRFQRLLMPQRPALQGAP